MSGPRLQGWITCNSAYQWCLFDHRDAREAEPHPSEFYCVQVHGWKCGSVVAAELDPGLHRVCPTSEFREGQ